MTHPPHPSSTDNLLLSSGVNRQRDGTDGIVVHSRTARQLPDRIEALAHYSISGVPHVVVAEIGDTEIVVVDAECPDDFAARCDYVAAWSDVWR